MLEEWDERRGDGCDLVGSDVDELNIAFFYYGEVTILTGLDVILEDVAIEIHGGECLRDDLVFFVLGSHVFKAFGREIDLAVFDNTIRCLEETEFIDFGVDGKRGDETDVGSLRGLDRTETTVVGVVDIADLETSAVTGKTTRTESRKTAFVSYLGQRVGLVHELR